MKKLKTDKDATKIDGAGDLSINPMWLWGVIWG